MRVLRLLNDSNCTGDRRTFELVLLNSIATGLRLTFNHPIKDTMANDKRAPDLKPVSLSSANIARKSYKMAYEDVSRRHSSNIYADFRY